MAYINTFSNVYGKEVLCDLAIFCRANESTFNSDDRLHAVAEGRREVWLRIQKHLQLNDEELLNIYGQVRYNTTIKENGNA